MGKIILNLQMKVVLRVILPWRTKHKDGSIEIIQPHLIWQFIVPVGQEQNSNIKTTPATKLLLHKDEDALETKHS